MPWCLELDTPPPTLDNPSSSAFTPACRKSTASAHKSSTPLRLRRPSLKRKQLHRSSSAAGSSTDPPPVDVTDTTTTPTNILPDEAFSAMPKEEPPRPSDIPKPVKLPIMHEIITTAHTAITYVKTGDLDAAAEKVEEYRRESVIGSAVASTSAYLIHGDEAAGSQYAKGFRRAAGSAVLGGGLFRDVPVCHELATLGDTAAEYLGGDEDAGDKSYKAWEEYSEKSVFGTGVKVAAAKVTGAEAEAERLMGNWGEASKKAVVRGAAAAANVGLMVGTWGMSIPLQMGLIVTTQVASDIAASATEEYIEKGEVNVLNEIAGDASEGVRKVDEALTTNENVGPAWQVTKDVSHAAAVATKEHAEVFIENLPDRIEETRATLEATRESGRRRLEEVNKVVAPAAAAALENTSAFIEALPERIEETRVTLEATRESGRRRLEEVNKVVAPAAAAALENLEHTHKTVVAPAAFRAWEGTRDGTRKFIEDLPENIEATRANLEATRESGRRRLEEVNAVVAPAAAAAFEGTRDAIVSLPETLEATRATLETARMPTMEEVGDASRTAAVAMGDASRTATIAAAVAIAEGTRKFAEDLPENLEHTHKTIVQPAAAAALENTSAFIEALPERIEETRVTLEATREQGRKTLEEVNAVVAPAAAAALESARVNMEHTHKTVVQPAAVAMFEATQKAIEDMPENLEHGRRRLEEVNQAVVVPVALKTLEATQSLSAQSYEYLAPAAEAVGSQAYDWLAPASEAVAETVGQANAAVAERAAAVAERSAGAMAPVFEKMPEIRMPSIDSTLDVLEAGVVNTGQAVKPIAIGAWSLTPSGHAVMDDVLKREAARAVTPSATCSTM